MQIQNFSAAVAFGQSHWADALRPGVKDFVGGEVVWIDFVLQQSMTAILSTIAVTFALPGASACTICTSGTYSPGSYGVLSFIQF